MRKTVRLVSYLLLGLIIALPLLALFLQEIGFGTQYIPQFWVDFLSQKVGENTLNAWLRAALATLGTGFVLYAIDHELELRLGGRTNGVLVILHKIAKHTSLLFIILVAMAVGSGMVKLPGDTNAIITKLFSIALFIQIGLWMNELLTDWIVGFAARKGENNPAIRNALSLIRMMARGVVWAVILILIVDNLGFDITALVAGLGLGGAAIALASQKILSDLFASLGLVLDKPFVVGDFINLGTQSGTVENIGLKTTRIRSISGEQLVIPNSDMLQTRIHNFRRMEERRSIDKFTVLYETDPAVAEALPATIKELVEGFESARFDRMHLAGFGVNGLEFELVYWVKSPNYKVFAETRHGINIAILKKFAELGVQFWHPANPSAEAEG